jgi:hypothetical protein
MYSSRERKLKGELDVAILGCCAPAKDVVALGARGDE